MIVSHQKAWNPGFTQLSLLFFPIMPYGLVFAKFEEWPNINDLNFYKPDHVCSFLSHNICFVEQKGKRQKNSFSTLYEPRIFLQGEVNTRPNHWHDFFNALIWFAFPKAKAVINMRHFIAFDEHADFPWLKSPKNRIREQDFLTMFDEGGCILVTFSEDIKIPFLFGHGFYERLLYGDIDLSACTLEINLDKSILNKSREEILFAIDNKVAQILTDRNYYAQEGAFKSISLNDLSGSLKGETKVQLNHFWMGS